MTEDIYVGSTSLSLAQRFCAHKYSFKQNENNSSCKILKYPDAFIELVEEFKNISKDELRMKEQELYETIPSCINYRNPSANLQESRYSLMKDYHSEYNKKHKMVRNAYSKWYYETHKDKWHK